MHFLNLSMSSGKIITTITGLLLQNMLEIHAPKLWVFGHFHQDKVFLYKNTLFVCLGINSCLRFDKNLNILMKDTLFW